MKGLCFVVKSSHFDFQGKQEMVKKKALRNSILSLGCMMMTNMIHAKTALLVVDAQYDFSDRKDAKLRIEGAEDSETNIIKLVEEATENRMHILASKDAHYLYEYNQENGTSKGMFPEFSTFPIHCLAVCKENGNEGHKELAGTDSFIPGLHDILTRKSIVFPHHVLSKEGDWCLYSSEFTKLDNSGALDVCDTSVVKIIEKNGTPWLGGSKEKPIAPTDPRAQHSYNVGSNPAFRKIITLLAQQPDEKGRVTDYIVAGWATNICVYSAIDYLLSLKNLEGGFLINTVSMVKDAVAGIEQKALAAVGLPIGQEDAISQLLKKHGPARFKVIETTGEAVEQIKQDNSDESKRFKQSSTRND